MNKSISLFYSLIIEICIWNPKRVQCCPTQYRLHRSSPTRTTCQRPIVCPSPFRLRQSKWSARRWARKSCPTSRSTQAPQTCSTAKRSEWEFPRPSACPSRANTRLYRANWPPHDCLRRRQKAHFNNSIYRIGEIIKQIILFRSLHKTKQKNKN